ncbi:MULTISPECIES: hypothetical protein [unclassified Streptomyces]|uniref:Uncharacterized protein n=2 Tax=Streptomyces TaxID=1883 RepID=A0ABU2RQ37_9ACTN|nr:MULTISPECIES: hypothetical protein [unclassified Streptomyces]HBF82150.1 hypothetical protein [Streptomyces sp.]AEN13752.1 hypothetical protein SACTE_5968 [Streptomyces sp. SirexAA-E]MBK3594958.1 hypothetical protein [Streptomyces sp. MBT51]MDT0430959.1 hypothetical protein [Streptomyces sp. DSM 41770]MYR64582.1 hypothetical protein [Streptomyces sp. SID4939]
MLRRIAITLATVAAAGFVAAGPAVADEWEGGQVGAGYEAVEGSHEAGEFLNLGGPYGITYGKGHKAHFAGESGLIYAQYLQGRN